MTQHMVGQEFMGLVNAIQEGFTARNEVTIAHAISGMGSGQGILVLNKDGDGVWTIGSNLSGGGPNQTLWIPAGVTVNIASGVTFTWSGPLIAFNISWKTGPGTFTYNPSLTTGIQFGNTLASALNVADPLYATPNKPSLVVGGNLQSVAGGQPTLQVYPYIFPTDGPAIDFAPGGASTTHVYRINRAVSGGNAYLTIWDQSASGQVALTIGGAGVGIVNTFPTHSLHLNVDDAFKATTLWSVPSDARLKTVLGVFSDGLAKLRSLARIVRYTWNGKAQTPTDGVEQVGWIAQENLEVAPELFKTYEDKLEESDTAPTTLYTANYSPVLFMLVNAVLELANELDTRTARLTAVEERLAALEAIAHRHTGTGNAQRDVAYVPGEA